MSVVSSNKQKNRAISNSSATGLGDMRCLLRDSGSARQVASIRSVRVRTRLRFQLPQHLHTHTHLPLAEGVGWCIQKNKTRQQRKTIASSSQHLRLNYCGPLSQPWKRITRAYMSVCVLSLASIICKYSAIPVASTCWKSWSARLGSWKTFCRERTLGCELT
jgi:hypothetical protein